MKFLIFPKIMAFLAVIICLTPATLLAQTNYTNVTYSDIAVGTPQTGSLSGDISDPSNYYGSFTGSGYKLTLQAGKVYQITVKYTVPQNTYENAGFYLLRSLGGDYDDVIDYWGAWYSEYTAKANYMPTETDTVYILLYDREENNLGYTIVVQEVLSYTEINYATLNFSGSSASANGTLNTKVGVRREREYDWVAVYNAAGYSFNAKANQAYKITVKYTQSEPSGMEAGFYMLKSTLEGYLEDDLMARSYGYEEDATELTLTSFYKSPAAGNAKILLVEDDYYSNNGLSYTVTVEEAANLTFYTDFAYSSKIPTNGTPVTGTSTSYIGLGYELTGKDHHFDAEANSIYKITCTFNSAQTFDDDDFGILLLKSEALQGLQSDIIEGFEVDNSSVGTNQGTLTAYFKAKATEQLKVLLYDFNKNSYNYTIQIEKANILSYANTAYVYQPLALGTPQSGTLKPIIGIDRWGYYDTYFTTGQGYQFAVEQGKKYRVTVNYNNPQYTPDSYWEAGYYLLNSGSLSGNGEDDVFDYQSDYTYDRGLTLTRTFTAPFSGSMRILLQNGRSDNAEELGYTIEVDEPPSPMTLAQLLNSTTKTIAYSNNLAYTDRGTMAVLVNDQDFGERAGEDYYAVAYKITLKEGDSIKIRSSKEGDSYLYLYVGDKNAYTYNDDGGENGDSYMEFKARYDVVCYIVVTDYSPERGGRYYLTVWNTDEEPDNFYPTPIIAKVPKANTLLKASVQNSTLRLSGLTAGKTWSVYTVSGALVHKGVANGAEANLHLNASGVYFVKSNGQAIRVVNR